MNEKLLAILGNKELGDDREIKIGEETYNLGDLRAVNAERESLRGERETLARERDDFRGKYEKQSSTLTELLGDAHKRASEELEAPAPKSIKEQLREIVGTDEDPALTALFEDKVFGKALTTVEQRAYDRAKKEFEGLEAKFTDLQDKMTKGFEGMTVAQLNERAERWYSDNRTDIPKGEDGKKMSLRAIHDYAMERNMVKAGTRLIDYDAALEQLTEPTRREAQMTEAEKRGFQKGLEAGRRGAAEVIPIFGDRSAGGTPEERISTAGKSRQQMIQEALQRGLTRESASNE